MPFSPIGQKTQKSKNLEKHHPLNLSKEIPINLVSSSPTSKRNNTLKERKIDTIMAPLASSFAMSFGYVDTSNNIGCTSSSLSLENKIQPLSYGYGSPGRVVPGEATTPSKDKKKSVSFRNSVRCRRTISLNQYTKEEINACWVTEDESKSIRSDVKFASNLLASGFLDSDTEQHCRRGLEYQTTLGALRRNRIQVATREPVLNEQDIQHHQCGIIVEPSLIAAAYQPISQSAIEKARSIALKDAMDAMVP